MNIIDAWKKTKVGEKITIEGDYPYSFLKGEEPAMSLERLFVDCIGEDNQLSDDWEVERVPLVWEGEVIWLKALESELFTARREIDRLTSELNDFKTLATELTRERDEWMEAAKINGQKYKIERKALEEACDILDKENMYAINPDYFRKKAKGE